MQIKNITIIGCGWLGCILGRGLLEKGFNVSGSARSKDGLNRIIEAGISGFLLDLDSDFQLPEHILNTSDLVVLALPPQKRSVVAYYGNLLCGVVQKFPEKTRVILTSSTGIYPKINESFTEYYSFKMSEQNTSLFQAEKKLQQLLRERLTILRLGGLIGPGRHPINSLAGRSIPNDGTGPINLIHSSDVLLAILLIVNEHIFGKCYNLVFPLVTSKNEYYNRIAMRKGLKPVLFGSEKALERKIDGKLITKQTGFEYVQNPNEYDE